MIYSVIYAHLEKPLCKVGDYVKYGSKIGIEGTTGKSTGVHLHLAVVEGIKTASWTLVSMVKDNKPSKKECEYFITDDIWTNGKTKITTKWLGYENHFAYDIVNTIKDSRELQWNRSYVGLVTCVGYNSGYGNYVIITYSKSTKLADLSDFNENASANTINELKSQIEALNKEIERYKHIESEQTKTINELNALVKKQSKEKEVLNNEIVLLKDKLHLAELQVANMPRKIFTSKITKEYRMTVKKGDTLFVDEA